MAVGRKGSSFEKSPIEKEIERLKDRAYQDKKGRWRFESGDGLVSRKVAYKEIYKKNKKEYPMDFNQYVVYHKDQNVENFSPDNLILVPVYQHESVNKARWFAEKQKRLVPAIKMLSILLFIFAIVLPFWIFFSGFLGFSGVIRAGGFSIITLFSLLIVLIYSA